MKYFIWLTLALALFTGCSHTESYEIICVVNGTIIPYVSRSVGPVFTVTYNGVTYLTFIDRQGNRQVFDNNYECRIGE